MNKVMVDIETTGLVKGTHEICDLAIVGLDEDFRIREGINFTSRVKILNPNVVSDKAMEIHGISLEDLESAPTPAQIRRALLEWKNDIYGSDRLTIVGWNPQFDMGFLEIFLKDLFNDIFTHRVIDIHSIIQYKNYTEKKGLNPDEITSTKMCEIMKIARAKNHSGLSCCKEMNQVLLKLLT